RRRAGRGLWVCLAVDPGGATGGAAGGAVAALVLLARTTRAQRVAADTGELVVGVGDGPVRRSGRAGSVLGTAERGRHQGRAVLGRRGVGQLLGDRLLEP